MYKLEHVRDVYAWIEQTSSVMLKAVSPHGDPVELAAAEAIEVGEALVRLGRELEALDRAT